MREAQFARNEALKKRAEKMHAVVAAADAAGGPAARDLEPTPETPPAAKAAKPNKPALATGASPKRAATKDAAKKPSPKKTAVKKEKSAKAKTAKAKAKSKA
jgi:hypothetical protein